MYISKICFFNKNYCDVKVHTTADWSKTKQILILGIWQYTHTWLIKNNNFHYCEFMVKNGKVRYNTITVYKCMHAHIHTHTPFWLSCLNYYCIEAHKNSRYIHTHINVHTYTYFDLKQQVSLFYDYTSKPNIEGEICTYMQTLMLNWLQNRYISGYVKIPLTFISLIILMNLLAIKWVIVLMFFRYWGQQS